MGSGNGSFAPCAGAAIALWHQWRSRSQGIGLSHRRERALPLLEEVAEPDTAMRGGRPLSTRLIWQGEAYLLAGRVEEAKLLALQALDLVRTRKELGHEAWTLLLLGEIAAQRGPANAEPAESYSRQGLALAEARGMRPLPAHCDCALGTLYVKTGRLELARIALSAAIALYRDMAMTSWLPKAEATLAGGRAMMAFEVYTPIVM